MALVPRGSTAHADQVQRRCIFEWAAAAGFQGVEISPQWLNLAELTGSELTEVRNQASACGLVISGLNFNRILRRNTASLSQPSLPHRALDVAAILAAEVVTLSLSLPLAGPVRPVFQGRDVPPAEREQHANGIRALAAQAKARGLRLSLELHDDGLLDTPDLCLEMLQSVAAENVGLNPDLGNLVRGGPNADWRAALLSLAPFANNWHVKNYRDGQPSPLWDGQIDYALAIQIMRAAGYTGWVSIESYFGDVLDLQAKSLAYLKQLVISNTSAPQR